MGGRNAQGEELNPIRDSAGPCATKLSQESVPVCPEVEVGMGTLREAMRSYARRRVEQIAGDGLSGYILKKNSPSCGLERVRLHHGHGRVTRSGRGWSTFAAVLNLSIWWSTS